MPSQRREKAIFVVVEYVRCTKLNTSSRSLDLIRLGSSCIRISLQDLEGVERLRPGCPDEWKLTRLH